MKNKKGLYILINEETSNELKLIQQKSTIIRNLINKMITLINEDEKNWMYFLQDNFVINCNKKERAKKEKINYNQYIIDTYNCFVEKYKDVISEEKIKKSKNKWIKDLYYIIDVDKNNYEDVQILISFARYLLDRHMQGIPTFRIESPSSLRKKYDSLKLEYIKYKNKE